MSLSFAVVLALLAQRPVPLPLPPPGPPAPYFTELADYAGLAGTKGYVDGKRFFAARLDSPTWIASEPQGRSWLLTAASPTTSVIRFIAGDDVYTWSLPIQIPVGDISGLAVNAYSHELYFTDGRQHLIYKVAQYGAGATLFAGSSDLTTCDNQLPPECYVGGYHDDLGQAALFTNPRGLAVDSMGNVYVSDAGNNTIRKITPGGQVTTLFSPVADFFPIGMVLDEPKGRLVVLSRFAVYSVTLTGQITWLAGVPQTFFNPYGVPADGEASVARFANPRGLAVDGTGNIFVTDYEVTSGGTVYNPTYTYRGAIRQITPGVNNLRYPYLSYPTTVKTLSLSAAFIPYGFAPGQGFASDAVLLQPIGLAWVGNMLAVTDYRRQTVRLIR